jgi:hypothetical protein
MSVSRRDAGRLLASRLLASWRGSGPPVRPVDGGRPCSFVVWLSRGVRRVQYEMSSTYTRQKSFSDFADSPSGCFALRSSQARPIPSGSVVGFADNRAKRSSLFLSASAQPMTGDRASLRADKQPERCPGGGGTSSHHRLTYAVPTMANEMSSIQQRIVGIPFHIQISDTSGVGTGNGTAGGTVGGV